MSISLKIIDLIEQNLNKILALRNDFKLKKDNSYVSKGDLFVQEIIYKYLCEKHPKFILISEELFFDKDHDWDKNKSYIILDPIDGTENFVSGLKEWGIGLSIYENGKHIESCIYLPELNEKIITGQSIKKYNSRIYGLSSSLNKSDLVNLEEGFEYRIIGCSMYNMFNVIRGSYFSFQNPKGVNCWDILPGLNLALENNCEVYLDGIEYKGEIIFPYKKYKVKVINKN